MSTYKDQLQKYYNLKYFMSNPDNWQELANQAVARDLAKYQENKLYKGNTLDEIVVTPKGTITKVPAVETDFTPHENKTLATPDKKTIHYSDYEGRKNMLEAQSAANKVALGLGINAINKVGESVKKIYNLGVLAFQSFPRRIQNKINQYSPPKPQIVINGPGTDIVKLDKDAIRVTPETEQRGTLFNEFVEAKGNPTIRTAGWYKLNQDLSVGDHNIPVANFTYYGGLENGAFKIQPLTLFNDTTTVIPARNLKRGVIPIKEILNPDISTLSPQKELEKELRKLILPLNNEIYGVVDKYIPWYESKSEDRVLSNPYVVPNTGELLSEKEMENISKRLRLYDDFDFSNTDSLRYYIDDYHNATIFNQERDVIEKAHLNLNEFLKRLPKYKEAFEKVLKEKLKSIKDFSSELSPEELMLLQLHFSEPYQPSLRDVVYGGVLGIGNKYKKVPNNVYHLINPNRIGYYGSSAGPTGQKFLKLYDLRLADIANTRLNLRNKLRAVLQELENIKPGKIKVVTTNNDTIPISQYNASILDKKAILGNPNGSMFIADFGNMSLDQLANEVNPYLKENPSVLFMPDMGAYSLYGLKDGIDPKMLKNTYMDVSQKPTYNQYWNLFTESESKAPYNPDMHYLIGVKKHGGHIQIKEKNKGKFTESAKRAGKSVQEHAKDVVNNPKATKLQKRRAQFALNAKKFKHLEGGKINYLNIF